MRLDGSFPLVKPIIAAVTSRLLTGPRLPSRNVNVSVFQIRRYGQKGWPGQTAIRVSYVVVLLRVPHTNGALP